MIRKLKFMGLVMSCADDNNNKKDGRNFPMAGLNNPTTNSC